MKRLTLEKKQRAQFEAVRPDWMVIDAVRYAIGRMSYQVGITCGWLVHYWPTLSEHTKYVIKQDVDEAFEHDDAMRAGGSTYAPLGMDMDRRELERVRALWQ